MARIQDAPQSTTYTKKADKKKTAKPVGYRFTDKKADKLGKKSTSKPSASEIEKFLGKGVYKEKRADKSDIKPKDKFAKGGQASPQSGSYTARADKKKTAKPVGVRFTDKLANRLGKKATTKPTLAEAEKYMGKGVYKENRKDKSDINPKNRFAKGGTAQTYAQYPKTYNEFRDITKEAKPVGYRYTDALAKRLGVNPLSKPSNAHVEKYLDKGVYWENRADKSDQNRKDKLAKGGYMADGGDTEFTKAQAVDLVKQSGKKRMTFYYNVRGWGVTFSLKPTYATPTGKAKGFPRQVSIYADGKITGKNYSYEHGGDTEYARGGQAPSYKETYFGNKWTKKADKEEKGKRVGYRYTDKLAKRLGVNKYAKPTDVHIDKYLGNGIYFENRKDKSDVSPKDKLAKGGEVGEKYEVELFFKGLSGDNRKIGKYVVSQNTLDNLEDEWSHVLSIDVIDESEKDSISWYNLKKELYAEGKEKGFFADGGEMAKGGTTQTYPQSQSYNEFRDIQKDAKPVGYRYTDALAKRLGVSPLSKPSKAHIDKYLDKGVYWENRADKSDQNRKDKLEDGGEMAKGGGTRISNSEASSYAENHQPFRGNNLEAKTLENGDYVVLSYGYYPIWYWNKKENKWYQNKDKFSQTTARHITASRPTYDAQVVSRNEMDNMMAKSLEGNGFMALGGELSSFVVTQ